MNASTTLALAGRVAVGARRRAADAPSRAAGQLPGGLGRAVDQRRDLAEGHGEEVVQDEGQPLGGRQRLEHDQQRQGDGVGQLGLVRGVAGGDDDRIGHVGLQRLLAPGPAGAQHVQAHARQHRRQPRAEVLDSVRVAAAKRSQVSWTASSASLSEPSIR